MKEKKKLTEEERIEVDNAKKNILKYIDGLERMNKLLDKILGNSNNNGIRKEKN